MLAYKEMRMLIKHPISQHQMVLSSPLKPILRSLPMNQQKISGDQEQTLKVIKAQGIRKRIDIFSITTIREQNNGSTTRH